MGSGESVQFTTRPSFERLINPASSRTPRCFMKPGNDMLCGLASSITGRLPSLNDARIFRRVESESAANTVSRSASSYLTIRFSISRNNSACQVPGPPFSKRHEERVKSVDAKVAKLKERTHTLGLVLVVWIFWMRYRLKS